MKTLPNLMTIINMITNVLTKLKPANLLESFEHTFFDVEQGELNKNGLVLAGIIFIIAILIVGYIEGGGLFPWE